jgi:adenosylcobalamin-dependent ribonucleoside-triphosphate reductase
MASEVFALSRRFLRKYKKIRPSFGFQGLGEVVYKRTYSRNLGGEEHEEWWQTCERVVNGTMNIERKHVLKNGDPWIAAEHTKAAEDMYDRIFSMKFMPGGRGLAAMGSKVIEERHLYAALNNCAFVSTSIVENIDQDMAVAPFTFLMDMSMCGVGTGFDTLGEGKRKIISKEDKYGEVFEFIIPDSREGWVVSLKHLIQHYFFNTAFPVFNYSLVRAEGELIRGFGGISGGPEPLKNMHGLITTLLENRRGEFLTITDIVDIMNIIGQCVVSGNVRRSAEIAFGPNVPEFLNLKNLKVNQRRKDWMWTSNNSVLATVGMNYKDIAELMCTNGEPGIIWLDNIHKNARMRTEEDNVWDIFSLKEANLRLDSLALGTNPCGEQPLESFELCNLVEVFPAKHVDFADFALTLGAAYRYAKTVALTEIHWEQSVEVMQRNRRFGISLSGIAQFIAKHSIEALEKWCMMGYDLIRSLDVSHSAKLKVNQSIRVTTIKPSGTVSLLAGATPGLHFPISPYYTRRVRIARSSPYIDPLREAGYHIEQDVKDEKTLVVEFPVSAECDNIRSEHEVSMEEQLELAAFLQRHWSDNAVSATIKFDPVTEGPRIADALDKYQHLLKGISFLPNCPGVYDQMPYETITKTEYEEKIATLKPIVWKADCDEPRQHIYCDTEGCTLLSPFRQQE